MTDRHGFAPVPSEGHPSAVRCGHLGGHVIAARITSENPDEVITVNIYCNTYSYLKACTIIRKLVL